MPWKLSAVFSSRPYVTGSISMDFVESFTLEYVDDHGHPAIAPRPSNRDRGSESNDNRQMLKPTSLSNYIPAGDPRPRHSGYVQQERKSAGSMPLFEKPRPDSTATQDEIDAADLEGYSAFLEGKHDRCSDARPYPVDSTLDRAWRNGWDRAEHSDDREDGDGV